MCWFSIKSEFDAVWASAGSFADGRRVEYKAETTFQENGNTRIEAGAVILNNLRNEYRDTYLVLLCHKMWTSAMDL